MTLGGRACDVLGGRQASRTRRGRGRAVIACAVEAVTHLIPYQLTRVFASAHSPARSLSRQLRTHPARTRHARTHRTTSTSPAHFPGCTRTHTHCTLFFAHHLFFVACLYGVTYFCPRMTNQAIPHFILETSQVPFGHEPTVVGIEPSYEKAMEAAEFLNLEYPEFCYEICEA